MSGTFMSPIHPLSLPSTNHKHYYARSSIKDPHTSSSTTPLLDGNNNTATTQRAQQPTSLAHDLLAKHSAKKWLKKQRREFELNQAIREAKHEASKAEEVGHVDVRERLGSLPSAAEEGKMIVAFAG